MPIVDVKTLPYTDLTESVMFTDPFPRYAELRATAPVSRGRHREMRTMETYLLTRYADVQLLHSDPRFSSDPASKGRGQTVTKMLPKTFRLLTDSMVYKDDPDHKRLRGLVNKAFTPKRVAQMTEGVQRSVEALVDALADKGTVEFVGDFAVPLPLSVIAEMLGVPPKDRDDFKRAVVFMAEGTSSGSARDLPKALSSGRKIRRMLARLADERRHDPDDGLISAVVAANEDGVRLDEDEVVSMLFLLLFAGQDTTSNLLSSSILAFLEHPEQLARLRAEPHLIDTAVEELLRYTTPVPCGTARTTLDDVEIAGVTIPRQSTVIGMIISANRDESVFDRPDELDLGREPNRHLSFAFGGHFCLGNQLARLEARTALTALVQRFDTIELAAPRDALRYKPTISLRGLRALPLRLS